MKAVYSDVYDVSHKNFRLLDAKRKLIKHLQNGLLYSDFKELKVTFRAVCFPRNVKEIILCLFTSQLSDELLGSNIVAATSGSILLEL